MKIKVTVLIVLVLITNLNLVNAQNALTDCDSIPLVCYLYGLNDWGGVNPKYSISEFQKIDSLRFHSVEIYDLNNTLYNRDLYGVNYRFKIIPDQVNESVVGQGKNLIIKYTEAKYSVWQAEGTPPEDGEATLVMNAAHIDTDITHSYIFTKNQNIPKETELINGPSYWQDATYNMVDKGDTVNYIADFCMKLEELIPGVMQSSDTVCNLQVTTCIYNVVGGSWVKTDSFIIAETPLFRGSFPLLNQWEHFQFQYNLAGLPDYYFNNFSRPSGSPNPPHWNDDSRNHVQHIEFKVIWKGNAQAIRLSTDSVTVFDIRGFQLHQNLFQNLIVEMTQSNYSFSSKISGWFGVDEPHSIDNFEPIRIVSELLENQSNPAKLWISLEGSWSGCWGNPDHGLSAGERINKVDEFFKRVKRANVLQNIGAVEWPWTMNTIPPPTYDPRIMNIDLVAESFYAHFNQYPAANWGSSVLAGAVPDLNYPEVDKNEMLYQTNLALLYGAKILAPWLIFGSNVTGVTGLVNDIIDMPGNHNFVPTEKYYTMRDIIAPRLGGLLGKTLKKLNPLDQYAGSNGISCDGILPPDASSGCYSYIENVVHHGLLPPEYEYGIDLGFFIDNINPTKRYFMILNRYYSTINIFKTKLCDLLNYQNWNLFNYVDTTERTLQAINNNVEFIDTLLKGDANLYSIHPVVIDGGKLDYNETVQDGTTLLNNMTIENGATLTVNGTYHTKANITVKSGGKIIAGTNGKIIFDPNKSITVEGSAEIKGFTNNKLSLEFSNSTAMGVEAQFGSNLSISNCIIKNAIVGIKVENGSTANISYVDFTDCSDNAVVMFGFSNGENAQTLPTPTVYRCTIENSSTGISVVNCDQLVLKENTINHCNLGIFLNMVNSAYISSNTILGLQSATGSPMPGISMGNGGGYLRNNTIRYHNFGVLLDYASPDLGVNTIENNYKCGVYSSIGSFPNLVQQLANPQCWYPIGGCNVIRNNGTFIYLPPSTPEIQPDGAEIFLNSGDVILSYGYNEISDDRTGIPTYLTIPLIKGTRSRGGSREFFVDYNYWGTVGPSPLRFGTLEADYDPTAGYCPLPDMPCSGNEIIIQTTDGIAVDTIGSRERDSGELAALEESYALADKLFYSGDLEGAKIIYEQIVAGPYTSEEKLFAYKKLYEIGEILKEDAAYFSSLQNAFNSILSVETDTLLIKTYNQSSILCDVSKEEYLTAISKFDNIIQQNPNSEEAVYAEIDIITTALNLDTTNTQLGKIAGGKYLVKGTSDYLSKLNDILQSKFGINPEEKEQIIPKEYSLHQNYPNPFNPTTTIKFDLPNDGLITLEIFDILGRRISTLVEEYKTAGSYEQVFNASSIASGVYVYKLQAGDFISSKKMILLK